MLHKGGKIYCTILAAVAGLIFIACGGSIPGTESSPGGTGVFGNSEVSSSNPATRPTPGFTAVTVNPATSTTSDQNQKFNQVKPVRFLALALGGVELDEVRLVIENLNFDDSISPGIEGPGHTIIRLIQNGQIVDQSLPLMGTAILPEGNYRTLDFNYKILAASDIPPEAQDDPVITQHLVNHSIVIEGSYLIDLPLIGNLLRIPFRFISDQTSTIRIEDPSGLPFFGQDQPNFLFIVHKVQLWFDATVVNLLQSLSLTVLPVVGGVVNGILELSANSTIGSLRDIAVVIQDNIDTGFRFALSPDGVFEESEVLEASFSLEILP